MRWLARRLLFYAFAIWVALTINFLLPRLMPGDPIAGLLAHLNPSQLAANPGLIQTYEALLGGSDNSIWQDYVTYLHRIATFDFGLSTSNYPTPVSEVIGRTLPYSIFLVGVAFFLSFFIGIAIGMRIFRKICIVLAPNDRASAILARSVRRKPVAELIITIGPTASAIAM